MNFIAFALRRCKTTSGLLRGSAGARVALAGIVAVHLMPVPAQGVWCSEAFIQSLHVCLHYEKTNRLIKVLGSNILDS